MVRDSPRLSGGRKELPIERGFPIERINEIAAKESRAKRHYRPVYTMHKWWARRLGCVFRSICLYSLVDDSSTVEIHEPGENGTLSDYGGGHSELRGLIENVGLANPESLWELYPKDVRIEDKKLLDPFAGGGTSLVEASRFGVEADGYDLNPVAWFSTKKELDAGQTDVGELEAAFERVEGDIADEIRQYYRTVCPNGDHDADVMYNFWVKELDCVSCGRNVPLFKDYRVANGRYEHDDEYNVYCPDCESVVLVDDWQSECACPECTTQFVPSDGTVSRGGYYNCPDCGQKYRITDAMQEQDGFRQRLYALEYYCADCDDPGAPKSDYKGYKRVEEFDRERYEKAVARWETEPELRDFVPDTPIRKGAATSNDFGTRYDGYDLEDRGYHEWTDLYNARQLLSLSLLLRRISEVEDTNSREFLLLAFSDALRTNTMMASYQFSANKSNHIFKTNSFDPPMRPSEGNVWGTEYGMGTFESAWSMVLDGVRYATSPTERYVTGSGTEETPPFGRKIGENASVHQGDMRAIDAEDEYDAVITDPPYYDNIMYSDLSDFFYVWQRLVLAEAYDWFVPPATPRSESIVAHPAEGKGVDEFEDELGEGFDVIRDALKADGVLSFTYHHSDSESWGELLQALCDADFEVTATYPISSDLQKFTEGEVVEFDIVIVARPADNRQPISWKSLRRNIVRTAKQTHQRLTENRELAEGDIGVIEMGRAFHEYSKHHGKVRRDGGVMDAKEVVDEIYGIIQQGSDIGEVDVFLDLLEMDTPTYSDLSMLARGTSANADTMTDTLLYRMKAGEFVLGTWDDQKRQAYIRERVNGDGDDGLTPLDKAQFLRHRYEQGKSIQNYLQKWTVSDDLHELCDELAEASDDDVYNRILGGDRTVGDY